MIYVSSGHEKGIGLEVFLKAFLCLSKKEASLFHLFVQKEHLTKCLNHNFINGKISENKLIFGNLSLKITLIKSSQLSFTLSSLEEILRIITVNDILLTLPSSKDQMKYDQKSFNGYTEFLRYKFSNKNITMNFLSHDQNVLLLSDHISINEVTNKLTEEFILEKTITTLDILPALREIKDVYFSGIDPHCGEGGLISNYDSVFKNVIPKLKNRYPQMNFHGPFPSDTLHLKYGNPINKLFIYSYHDQGLNAFKLRNGLVGINLTLGLPFIRLSVDHGTAFDLYGKNQANYIGMSFLLKEILSWQKKSPTKK